MKRNGGQSHLVAGACAAAGLFCCLQVPPDWPEYLGDPERTHHSSLRQLDTANVHRLRLAWTHHTRDSGQMQCNPIVVGGVLYGMTASTQPFALDAATGRERWRWRQQGAVLYNTSRGVAYWADGDDQRILFTNGPWLYALDARTGKPIESFGEGGRVSLKTGLGAVAHDRFVVSNTPGTVYGDLIIMPLRVSDGTDPAPGHIQAFNVRTGRLVWVFRTIPLPGEPGYETWPKDAYRNPDVGGANNWAGMALDRHRGIVYVPTGSAAADYYGGNRLGKNLFANCLLALDAKTGQRRWHYQFVHHDILDRDAPAPPNLVTVRHGGKRVDAVAQVTKHGYVFLFDRVTGRPLFPIREVPAPASDLPGERAWPTQPRPVKPAPFARQTLSVADVSPYADNRRELEEIIRRSRYAGPFTPHSRQGTLIFPGFDGGAEWGGAAVDPEGVLYVNSNEMAWLVALDDLQPRESLAAKNPGERLYATRCTACHGADRAGNPASGIPTLVGIGQRRRADEVAGIIANGKGMMPAFGSLTEPERKVLLAFLFGQNEGGNAPEPGVAGAPARTTVPYRVARYGKFLDNRGRPGIRPPWGTLNAIDLNTGEYRWKIPYGEYPDLVAQGITGTGAESYGGPVVTAGGLLFIAGTKDRKFRAFNKRTGKLLWETTLPAAGFATPSIYQVGGKQYVVIACGGDKLGAPKGDSYVAFALP